MLHFERLEFDKIPKNSGIFYFSYNNENIFYHLIKFHFKIKFFSFSQSEISQSPQIRDSDESKG